MRRRQRLSLGAATDQRRSLTSVAESGNIYAVGLREDNPPAGKLGHGKRTFRLAKELNVVLTGPEYAQRRLTHRDYGDDWQGDNLDGGPIERDSNSRPSGYNHSVDRPNKSTRTTTATVEMAIRRMRQTVRNSTALPCESTPLTAKGP